MYSMYSAMHTEGGEEGQGYMIDRSLKETWNSRDKRKYEVAEGTRKPKGSKKGMNRGYKRS